MAKLFTTAKKIEKEDWKKLEERHGNDLDRDKLNVLYKLISQNSLSPKIDHIELVSLRITITGDFFFRNKKDDKMISSPETVSVFEDLENTPPLGSPARTTSAQKARAALSSAGAAMSTAVAAVGNRASLASICSPKNKRERDGLSSADAKGESGKSRPLPKEQRGDDSVSTKFKSAEDDSDLTPGTPQVAVADTPMGGLYADPDPPAPAADLLDPLAAVKSAEDDSGLTPGTPQVDPPAVVNDVQPELDDYEEEVFDYDANTEAEIATGVIPPPISLSIGPDFVGAPSCPGLYMSPILRSDLEHPNGNDRLFKRWIAGIAARGDTYHNPAPWIEMGFPKHLAKTLAVIHITNETLLDNQFAIDLDMENKTVLSVKCNVCEMEIKNITNRSDGNIKDEMRNHCASSCRGNCTNCGVSSMQLIQEYLEAQYKYSYEKTLLEGEPEVSFDDFVAAGNHYVKMTTLTGHTHLLFIEKCTRRLSYVQYRQSVLSEPTVRVARGHLV